MGAAAAAPYIAYFVFINIGGFLADRIRSANLLSTGTTRKLAMIIGKKAQILECFYYYEMSSV